MSKSSGTFEKMKSCTHSPVAPSPQSRSARAQIVARSVGAATSTLYSRCGAVRAAPHNEKSASAPFHAASARVHASGGRPAMSRRPPTTSARYSAQSSHGSRGWRLQNDRPLSARNSFSKRKYKCSPPGTRCQSWTYGCPKLLMYVWFIAADSKVGDIRPKSRVGVGI